VEDEAQKIQEGLKAYRSLQIQLSMAESKGNQQDVDRLTSELRDMKQDLQNQQGALTDRSDAFQEGVGRYYANRQEQGTDVGAVASFFLGRGAEVIAEGMTEMAIIGARAQVNPAIYSSSKVRDLELKEAREKSDFTDWGTYVQQLAGVSDEKMDEFSQRNLFTQVVSGVAESLPSFISPSKFFNTLALTGQTLKQWEKMTSGPEWDDVSETKKAAFAVPFIFTQVALERYGFGNIKAVNNLSGKILSRVFGKSVGKLTPKTLAELVEQDIKSALGRAGVVSGNAFLAEAETGALQEISAEGLKQLYNKFGDTEFDVTESLNEFFSQVATSALHEGLGGLMLGSRAAFRASRNNFSDEDMMRLNLMRDQAVMDLRESERTKKKVLGNMTQREAEIEAQNDSKLNEIVKQIPSDASISTQKQLFRKLQREAGLKDEISKKGARMSFDETQQLKEVQKEIDDIGENYEKLTPEQKAEELREITQPINPTGGVTVETADGKRVKIKADEVSDSERAQNDQMEEAPESQDAVQLSLFDEASGTVEQQQPTEEVDPSDFAEVKVADISPESMEKAGFSTEYQSLVNKVRQSVGEGLARGADDKIVNHRTSASILQAVKGVSPKASRELRFGQFVMGFVNTPEGGGPQEIHLLDTNSTDFTEQVKEAAKTLGRSYKIASAVELVSEELVTHYMLQDMFGTNGTKREDFYNELNGLAASNPRLARLISDTQAEYTIEKYGEAKQQEEVIAEFFNDYIKSPSSYRSVWQRISDWFNNLFQGKRVINSESDLMSVARNVNNIISGVSVDVQTPTAQAAGTSFATTSGSTYLKDETIYYKLDRNAGVEYQEWANRPPKKAQKIRVNDYFHFRNWYNKMTANQKFPDTITEMYFVKDGKKHTVKPPKPKTDSQGNPIEMPRALPTNRDIKTARYMREQEDLKILRQEYKKLTDEVYSMFKNSRLDLLVPYFQDFIPEGGPTRSYARVGASVDKSRTEGLDFEGYIIAKKNIQALIDSDIPDSEIKGAIRLKKPELFNLTDSYRKEDEPGTVIDTEAKGLSFNIMSGDVASPGQTSFDGVDILDPSIPYSQGGVPKISLAMNYDPAGSGVIKMMYGDTPVEFKTDGGVAGLLATGNPDASIAQGDPAERKKLTRVLKYYHLIHTSSEEEIRGFIESEIEKNNSNADAEESLRKALEIKKQLEEDNGRVSAMFHLSELRTLPGRKSLNKALLDMLMDSIESENDPAYTKRLLKDMAGPLKMMTPKAVRKYFAKFILREADEIDFTNEDHVRMYIDQAVSTASSFRGRQEGISAMPMFQSKTPGKGSRPKIYSKFPTITPRGGEDIWAQMVDGYIWSKMSEELMNRSIKTAGQALSGVIIDLNKLFSGPNRTVQKFEVRDSDFGFYLGGAEKPFYLSKKVFLNRKSAEQIEKEQKKMGTVEVFTSTLMNRGYDADLEAVKLDLRKAMVSQIDASMKAVRSTGKPNKKTTAKYVRESFRVPATVEAEKLPLTKSDPLKSFADGLVLSIASGRLSGKVADNSGSKGISVNQLLQVMGKASKAEKAILGGLLKKFPGQDFISKEELDMFFEGKMLQPLEEERNHANYGLDRLLGRSYRMADAVTVPFLGDEEIYGTAGIFEDHFGFPVHAHIRIFTHPNDPGIRYVSEIQSDTYQKGLDEAYDGRISDEVMIEDAGSDELGITVQNLDFLKYIVDNYEQYRTTLIVAARGEENAMNDKFWDDLLQEAEVVPEGRINDAPNVASLLSNAVNNNPDFNVRAFRAILKYYALSNLNAPIGSTDKQIEAIVDETLNKYPFVQEGEKSNLGRFATDLTITIDYITMNMSSLVIGEDMQYMSQEERLEAYKEVVETVDKNRQKKETERVEGIPSAEKSWEKQLIRYAVRQAQENGEAVVRFPTEKTAADIQWWDASDAELREYMDQEFGFDGTREIPDEFESEAREKQRPLRKRYRDLPKTLKSVGLESRVVQDQKGNRWYEVDVPPSDQRMIMFSTTGGRDNIGDVGGATWEARQRTSTEEWSDMWLTRLQDKYRKVFQLQEDVAKKTEGQVKKDEDFRMAEELMYGKAAEDLAKLDDATDRITMTLLENKLTVEELDEYMYALHAKERNAVIRERTEGKNQMGSGMSDIDAQKILDGKSEEKRRQLEEAASIVREIMQNTRDTMVELGLESQETIDAFDKMFKDYVPLQGKSVDEDDMAYSPYPNGGTGFSVSGATTKKARGRFTQTTNIVAQAIGQNAAVHVKGRTNEAMNALYNLAQNNPNPNVWQVLDKEEDGYKSDDPNIVSVRVNGVQKAIRFKDASYAQSLRKMNMPQTNYFVKAMGSINSWLRAAFTSRNPEFILSNFSRDIQSAVFNASAESEIEGGFLNGTAAMNRIFKLVGPSLKTLVRDEVGGKTDPLIMKYYEEFKADGGKTGWAYQKSLEDIASQLQVDDSGKTAGQKVIGGVKGALEFVEGMNDAFENSIRLSSYIAAREGGVSREKAAQFAKNITVNFNKQGEWGAAVNATYLFFNASVQGTARLGRSLIGAKPPVKPDGSRREWYERATTAQKAAGGMIIMNALLALLNRAASDEDEDGTLFYNKIPDYVKERNMIIMRPDGENYWKIPMPYGYNIFANIGTTSVEVASGDKEALEGLAFMAMSIVNAFSPISFGQAENLGTQFAKTSIPTAFKPFFEAFAFNETYFGGPVKAEQYPFGTPKPNSSMSFRSPEEIKQFFSWMNEATGGSEDVPGIIDINPDGGWYIFEYFLGGTGRFVTRSIETGRKIVADRTENPIDLDFNDIPFARIVYGEPSKYYDMQLFKDREVEIKQLVAEYKENRIPDAGDRYKGIGQLNEDLKKINKALKAVRAEKRAAKKITNYGERVSTLQRLMDKERKLVMMFNQRYEQFRGQD